MKIIEIPGYTFELVDHIPAGYTIWFIKMTDGYLPLCQCDADKNVNVNTLKAIRCDDAQKLNDWVASAPTKKESERRFKEVVKRLNK